ncbi:MAG: hypothetical protein VX265_14135 [Myxococcota bacterium]|nr:hypothetical protein [Myxococcota bacterium]
MGRDVPVKALFLATLLSACSSWVGPQALQAYPGVENPGKVVAIDKAAWKLVAVRNLASDRTADGRLHVRVELSNQSAKDLPVQLQVLFRDDAGQITGEDTPFQMVVLPGGAVKLHEVTSLRTDAAAYTVQVKTP